MAISRRKKDKKKHERQTGTTATATSTTPGVTIPKITPPADVQSVVERRQSSVSTPHERQQGSAATTADIYPKITAPKTIGSTSQYGGDILPVPAMWDRIESYGGGTSRGGGGTSSGGGGTSRGGGGSGSGGKIYPQIDMSSAGGTQQQQVFNPEYNPQIGGQAGQTDYQGAQYIHDQHETLRSAMSELKDEELAVAAAVNEQNIAMVNDMIAEYNQYYQQMGQGIDPATEAALARMKQEMEQDQRSILEYLNARGIAQSGITTAEFGKLAGQYSDQKSQMLAGRLSDLQNQFLTNMRGFMDQKIQGMGQFSQNQMGTQQRYTEGMQGAMQNAMDKTFGQWQQEQQQRAAMEREMVPYTQGPTPYQQQQLGMERQSQQQKSQQPSTQNLESLLYNEARAIVQEAESGSMDGPAHLKDWFDKNAVEMINNFGYSKYAQLREQIVNQMFPQEQKPSYF